VPRLAPVIIEKLYTLAQICEHLQLERHTVVKLFSKDPNVFKFGTRLRIPESSLHRVLAKARQ
jgi:hypothetical protein